jgi:hypothetical protein
VNGIDSFLVIKIEFNWVEMKETKHQQKWTRYKILLRLWSISWFLFLCEGFILVSLISKDSPVFIVSTFGITFIFNLLVGVTLMLFKCPECEERFFSGSFQVNFLQTHCGNCGKEKFFGSSYVRYGKRFGF